MSCSHRGPAASSRSATSSRTPARSRWRSSIWLSSPSRSPRISWRLGPTSRTAARRWRVERVELLIGGADRGGQPRALGGVVVLGAPQHRAARRRQPAEALGELLALPRGLHDLGVDPLHAPQRGQRQAGTLRLQPCNLARQDAQLAPAGRRRRGGLGATLLHGRAGRGAGRGRRAGRLAGRAGAGRRRGPRHRGRASAPRPASAVAERSNGGRGPRSAWSSACSAWAPWTWSRVVARARDSAV